jgi:methylmalonyl-CoA mutase
MAKAIESGLPKMRIEEAAARKQARIDSEKDIIVGVNRYHLEKEDPINILQVDNTAVRQSQLARLEKLKKERNQTKVDASLNNLTDCANGGKGNLLELSIEAARNRATLGEISQAIEKVSGRYKAVIRSISGVYTQESGQDRAFCEACEMADKFAAVAGRRPRIMIAKMGQDGHDRGAKVVSTGFADIGFDVDIGPLFQTPSEVAKQAVENDIHLLGVSSLAGGHQTLIPQVIEELKSLGRPDIMVVAGGVIPIQDYEKLYGAGVLAIFGPGTKITDTGKEILKVLLKAYG